MPKKDAMPPIVLEVHSIGDVRNPDFVNARSSQLASEFAMRFQPSGDVGATVEPDKQYRVSPPVIQIQGSDVHLILQAVRFDVLAASAGVEGMVQAVGHLSGRGFMEAVTQESQKGIEMAGAGALPHMPRPGGQGRKGFRR